MLYEIRTFFELVFILFSPVREPLSVSLRLSANQGGGGGGGGGSGLSNTASSSDLSPGVGIIDQHNRFFMLRKDSERRETLVTIMSEFRTEVRRKSTNFGSVLIVFRVFSDCTILAVVDSEGHR